MFTKLERERGTPQAFKAAARVLRDLFEVQDGTDIFEWVSLIPPTTYREDDGTYGTKFYFCLNNDPDQPLLLTIHLKRTEEVTDYIVHDPPKKIPGTSKVLLGEPIMRTDWTPLTVVGVAPGLQQWDSDRQELIEIKPEVKVFTVDFQEDPRGLVTWHADLPY